MNLKKIFDSQKIVDMAIVCKDGKSLKPRQWNNGWEEGPYKGGYTEYVFPPEENDGFESINEGDFVHALAKNRTSSVVLAVLVDSNGNAKEILRSDDLLSLKEKNAIDSFLNLLGNVSNVPTHIFNGGIRIC